MTRLNGFATQCSLWRILSVFFTLTLFFSSATAETRPMDPQAMEIYQRALRYLEAQPRFQIAAEVVSDVPQGGDALLQIEGTVEATVRRPSGIAARRTMDDGTIRQLWFDGTSITLLDRTDKVFARVDAPSGNDAALDFLETVIETPQPLADIFYSDLSPLQTLPVEAVYAGSAAVRGIPCDHLFFRGEAIDWQVWVEQGDRPLIRKFVIAYRTDPGCPRYSAVLTQWAFPPSVEDSVFQARLPQGAEEISIIVPSEVRMDKKGVGR